MMTCKEEFIELINDFKEKMKLDNEKISEYLVVSKQEHVEYTKEYLSLIFSRMIIEDLEFIDNIEQAAMKPRRFAYGMLRNTVEHCILYKYLMSNESEISIYFGENIDLEELESDEDNLEFDCEECIGRLKMLGQKRYKAKKRIDDMAESVGEIKSNDESMALYSIYKHLCDFSHDGYYKDFINLINPDKKGSKYDLIYLWKEGEYDKFGEEDDYLYMYMLIVLCKFINKYKEVMLVE